MTALTSTTFASELNTAKDSSPSPWQVRMPVILASTFVLMLTLSFKSYFYFVPRFSSHFFVIPALQIFALFGWIAMIIAPTLFFWTPSSWRRAKSVGLLISVLLWPVSIFLIKIVELIQFHSAYMQYWVKYPVFILMDVALPVFFVLLWRSLRSSLRS
jgi:hypothetical protein